jgi:hypothetical protein
MADVTHFINGVLKDHPCVYFESVSCSHHNEEGILAIDYSNGYTWTQEEADAWYSNKLSESYQTAGA